MSKILRNGRNMLGKRALSLILTILVLSAIIPFSIFPVNAANAINYSAPAVSSKFGINAEATISLPSPQAAGTAISVAINIYGTAEQTGKYIVSLTSETIGEITAPDNTTFHVVRGQSIDYESLYVFSFTLPSVDVNDLKIELEFTPEFEALGVSRGYNVFRYNLLHPEAIFNLNSTSASFLNSGELCVDKFYYTASTSQKFGSIDIETGKITVIKINIDYGFIAFNPLDGLIYAISSGSTDKLYTIDPKTGDSTVVTEITYKSGFPLAFIITNDGRFIVVDGNDDTIKELDPTTGDLTTLIQLNFNINYGQDLAIDRKTNTVYWASCSNEGEHRLFKINLSSNTIEYLTFFDVQTSCIEIIPLDKVEITEQPEAITDTKTDTEDVVELKVTAVSENNLPLSYQWYSCDDISGTNPQPIEGAESASYTVPTSVYGTYYYYCKIKTGLCGLAESDICTVNIECAHVLNNDDHDCTTELSCTVCNEVIAAVQSHDFNGAYNYNETYHWHICSHEGCDVINAKEAHSGGKATYSERPTCEVCLQKYGSTTPDITAPTGDIAIDTNHWNNFLNTVTFGLFFKETKTVTITADDSESGVAKIEYLLSDTVFNSQYAVTGTWNDITASKQFSLTPNSKQYIYVRLTDEVYNSAIINSAGVVIYSDSTISPVTATFDKKVDNNADIDFEMTLNGNILKNIKNGTTELISGTDYTVSGNTVTVKETYFAAQANGDVTLTFSFYPMGVENNENLSTAAATVTVIDTTHYHSMEHTEEVPATCTTDGNEEYWYCTACEKYFSDEDGNTEITDTVVSKLGHNMEHKAAVAATDTADGNIEHWYCPTCEKYFSDENGNTEIAIAEIVVSPQAPATEDISNTVLWMTLLFVSGAVLTTLGILKKRKKANSK